MRHSASLHVIAIAMAFGFSAPALAQTAANPAAAVQANAATTKQSEHQQSAVPTPGLLEEIVVTAERRAERLQDVPISVSTLTTRQLTFAGVTKNDALVQVTPGLVMNRQLTGGTPYLRGVGSQSTAPGDESPVATYIDGVYYPSASGNIFSFNNIAQVEVLRGPQGTLFGRNATGGLISITTREPSSVAGSDGSISYGNYNTLEGNLYATAGSETLKGDIALFGVDQINGYGRDTTTGAYVNRDREFAVRSKLVWAPTAADKFTLSGDWSRDTSDTGTVLSIMPGFIALDRAPYAGNPYNSRNNYPDGDRIDHWGVSLRYQRDLAFANFTLISAYRDLHSTLSLDQDGTPLPFVNVNLVEATHSFQEEALLVGHEARFDWTAGVFLFFADSAYEPLHVRSPIIPPVNFDTFTRQETQSYAGYAQGTYRLADATHLTVGLRYTVDRRQFSGHQLSPAGVTLATADTAVTYPKLTYRVALDQKLTPKILVYVSYNEGFKSGLFGTGSVSNTPVRPETLDAIEAGFKADLFDEVLRFNAAAFHYDYKDIQLNRIDNGASILLNAARGREYGGEIETTLAPRLPVGRLEITANVSLLDAKYTSFPNGPLFIPKPTGGNTQSSADLSGNQMIRSPKWTGNLGFQYAIPLGSGTAEISANYYHSAQFYWEPDMGVKQPAYSTVNAQLAYAFGTDDRFRIRLWGRNLTNAVYYVYATENTLGTQGNAAPPRTYGAALDFKF